MPAQGAAKTNAMALEARAALLQYPGSANVLNILAFHVQADAGDVGAIGQTEFGYCADQGGCFTTGGVFLYQSQLAVGAGFHVDTWIGGAAGVSAGFMDDEQRLIQHRAGFQANEQAIFEARPVQAGELDLIVIQGAAQLCRQGFSFVVSQIVEAQDLDTVEIRILAGFRNHHAVDENHFVAGHSETVAGLAFGRQGNGHIVGQLQVLAGVLPVLGLASRQRHIHQRAGPLLAQRQQRLRQGFPGRVQEGTGKHGYRFHSTAS